MSTVIDNGTEAAKSRGAFTRAFAKRAQPYEEGEFPTTTTIS